MEFFVDREFDCKCGRCGLGAHNMQAALLEKLHTARRIAKTPFIITSAVRCDEHNENEGGSPTSSHLDGWAVDIEASTSMERFIIFCALVDAGFERIGVNKNFIHVDCDPNKTAEVIWLY